VLTPASRRILRNNYDIPTSMTLHFPSADFGPVEGPANICVYKRMFPGRLHFPLPNITQELLCHLQVASYQIMTNGWWFLFACYLLWPTVNPRRTMTIPKFLSIYHPLPSKELPRVVTFTCRDKLRSLLSTKHTQTTRIGINNSFMSRGLQSLLLLEDLWQGQKIPHKRCQTIGIVSDMVKKCFL
jgi:hypothetical protein